MSTPRTPPPSLELPPDSSKRLLSDSAPGNDDSKRLKPEPAAAPAWAAALINSMDARFTKLDEKLASVDEKLGTFEGLNMRVGEMEEQVTANTDEIEDIKEGMAKLFAENKKLFAENQQLREGIKKLEDTKADSIWVAGIHDEQLRNSLTICGVKKGPGERHWYQTKQILAAALDKLTPAEYPERYWIRAIQRAHRGKQIEGKIPVIHCRFVSWADLDYLMNLFWGDDAVPNPDNLEMYEKHCAHTETRRKKALFKRTSIRAGNNDIKSYIKYPADVMVKKTGESSYTCVQKF